MIFTLIYSQNWIRSYQFDRYFLSTFSEGVFTRIKSTCFSVVVENCATNGSCVVIVKATMISFKQTTFMTKSSDVFNVEEKNCY